MQAEGAHMGPEEAQQPWRTQALPPGWTATWHAGYQRYFFVYQEPGQTTWTSTWTDPRVAQLAE
eukprot:6838064-Alexandrium_andersonii.AAC.1